MNGIKIRGTGRGVPARTVTNQDLERLVDTSDEWIAGRTGIRTRHHCAAGETFTTITAEAARRALEDAGISPERIGACIVATVTPETMVPSAACTLQRELGLPEDIPCFDLSAACTGFLFALHTMECLLNASPRKFGLVVGAENLSRCIDWTDRGTCILFGDGAGAAVVECREGWPSISAVMGCHGSGELLRLPGPETENHSFISMEGTRVFKFAVEAVPWCVDQMLKKTGRTMEDIDFFVFHQANARIIDLAVRKYHIPPEKYYKNIAEYGNTSAASIPLVLSELREQGKIGPGSRILAVGFGGGLTWGGCLVEFA
jgi:3-oxoacyl-[acyl-carrier-protein] synthase-3